MPHNYAKLENVLSRAYAQAAIGKGKERHATDLPFHEQPMQKLVDLYGVGFALGQAAKKAQEAQRMDPDKAVHELLGAIVYLSGAIIKIERDAPTALTHDNDNFVCCQASADEQIPCSVACKNYHQGKVAE